jgi:hypothetical protein
VVLISTESSEYEEADNVAAYQYDRRPSRAQALGAMSVLSFPITRTNCQSQLPLPSPSTHKYDRMPSTKHIAHRYAHPSHQVEPYLKPGKRRPRTGRRSHPLDPGDYTVVAERLRTYPRRCAFGRSTFAGHVRSVSRSRPRYHGAPGGILRAGKSVGVACRSPRWQGRAFYEAVESNEQGKHRGTPVHGRSHDGTWHGWAW